MPSSHTIHRHHHHFGWDNANPPALVVAPGDTVEFETVDSSGAQLSPTSTLADLAALDFAKVNPVTGPVRVDGAEPGDALKVTHPVVRALGLGLDRQHPGLRPARRPVPRAGAAPLEVRPVEPGAGRLRPGRARAAEAVRRHDRPGAGRARPAQHRPAPRAAAATWTSATSPPAPSSTCRSRSRAPCSRVGDTHAAQGDGEVCGTAIESPMSVALRFDLVKGANLRDAALHHARAGDPPSRRRGLRGHDRHRARPDAGGARRGERHGRPARRRASACARSRPTCCAASAPTCGSARSSTCRTGSCRSTSRASSCSDRRAGAATRRRRTAARDRGARGRLPRRRAGHAPWSKASALRLPAGGSLGLVGEFGLRQEHHRARDHAAAARAAGPGARRAACASPAATSWAWTSARCAPCAATSPP